MTKSEKKLHPSEVELRATIAKTLFFDCHPNQSWTMLMPQLQEEWKERSLVYIAIIEEAGYKSPEEIEQACLGASNKLLEAIETGKFKLAGFVQLAEDQTFPAFISLGGISEMELITVMRQADWKAGWRKVLLEGK